jgi:hypothetical protein
MAEPRAIKPSLAELSRAHHRPRSEPAGGQVQRPPGLRLGWRVVDAVSVDAVEHVLLRRADRRALVRDYGIRLSATESFTKSP